MRLRLVSINVPVLIIVAMLTLPYVECSAQRKAGKSVEKELFGKSRKSKPVSDKVKAKGAAGKAMKEQEKKQEKRDRESDKKLKELRTRHYNMQSEATRERMSNNKKKTEAAYKAKKQKQKREQTKPKKKRVHKP